jgi:hypothetical protein
LKQVSNGSNFGFGKSKEKTDWAGFGQVLIWNDPELLKIHLFFGWPDSGLFH